MSRKEDYVGVMEQRTKLRNAATKDVPTLLREEEYASCMVPRRRSVAMKDATTDQFKEEYVQVMVQRERGIHIPAGMKDALTLLSKEEYVLNMVHSALLLRDAVMKDV